MSRPVRWLLPLLTGAALVGCYTPTVSRNQSYHPSDADFSVTRISHASAILDFRETRILLDPWYAPTPPLGPSETIGVSVESLPPLRGMLITHRHDDHFDSDTLRNFPDKSLRVVVRRGLGDELRAMGYQDVVELEDWEQSQIGSVVVIAVPARHSVPENGYILQANSMTVYVAGDTRFDEALFRQIAARYPNLDAALLPVGGIRIVGRKLDMNPEEAAEAFAILKPARVIPYHYGLTGPFPFLTSASQPAKHFADAVAERDATARQAVVVLNPGESWHHYR